MQQNFNRVRDTQEIRTVPDYAALSKALQNDMLDAAQHIRNALYDHPHMKTLEIALIALDFPQFIPMPNTLEALEVERARLSDEWWETSLPFDGSMALLDKIEDLDKEIDRRKKPQAKASHEDAMVRYHELYNNDSYVAFREQVVADWQAIAPYEPLDVCNLLTDAAIEMCHIAIGADVPAYHRGKTTNLGILLKGFGELKLKAFNHLANFASRDLNAQHFYAEIKGGE